MNSTLYPKLLGLTQEIANEISDPIYYCLTPIFSLDSGTYRPCKIQAYVRRIIPMWDRSNSDLTRFSVCISVNYHTDTRIDTPILLRFAQYPIIKHGVTASPFTYNVFL